MIGYEIKENLLPNNYNHPDYDTSELIPLGLTIHETATPGATDENEATYFHTHNVSASAHYFVDYDSITRIIPENEKAWHAGPQANYRFLSIEMCNFSDPAKFQATWDRTIWLAADICVRYGFDPNNIEQLNTHNWISEALGGTDHTDPDAYFAAHGKTWTDFVHAVITEMLLIGGDDVPMPPYEDWMGQQGVKCINELAQIPDAEGKPLIQNPTAHTGNVALATPQWLFWSMIVRLAKRAK